MDFGEEQRLLSTVGAPPQDAAVGGLMGHGLSPEQLAALFLTPALNWRSGGPGELTVPGQSGQYNIMHDKNGRVGFADLTWEPTKKNVSIDMIAVPPEKMKNSFPSGLAAKTNEWAHGTGTSEVKSLVKSLMKTFPEAETVSGLRISGAKELAQNAGRIPAGSQQVTMRLPRGVAPLGGTTAPSPLNPGLAPPGTRITDLW